MSMIVIDGKEVPLLKAKSKTTIKNADRDWETFK